MLWVDTKYASFLSNQLDRWKQINSQPYLVNFRCPYCGDSQKNKHKARGYLFNSKSGLMFKCHNCNVTRSFYKFLEEQSPLLFSEYKTEIYFEKNQQSPIKQPNNHKKKIKHSPPVFRKKDALQENYLTVKELSKNHPCRVYCESRLIPQDKLKLLYYIDDIDHLAQAYGIYIKTSLTQRLGLPFYDPHDIMNGISCRTLDPNDKIRYKRINFTDEPMVFNANKVSTKEDIYVVEGPIDSLFLDNCVAAGDANLSKANKYFDKKNLILVYDNEPRNKEIVRMMLEAWYKDFKLVIWPQDIQFKDINEMVIAGLDPMSIIKKNTFSGLKLRMKLTEWKKVA